MKSTPALILRRVSCFSFSAFFSSAVHSEYGLLLVEPAILNDEEEEGNGGSSTPLCSEYLFPWDSSVAFVVVNPSTNEPNVSATKTITVP